MSDATAFISYRRQSSMHLARNIFTELNKRGINTFLDVDSIDATQFDTFILNQISARSAFVLVLSQHSLERCVNEGDWLLREIEHAYKTNRNIIPIYDAGFDWDAEKHYLPQHLQDYLTLRNAVSYAHEYYRGFIDKIARFVRHPQDHGEITITPASVQEARQADDMIREALKVTYDADDVIGAIGKFFELSKIAQTSTDFEELLTLWSEIRGGGNIPDFFNLDATEQATRKALTKQEAKEAEAKRRQIYEAERDHAYDFIRKLHQNRSIPRPIIMQSLQNFWKKYPEDNPPYDPDDISRRKARRQQQAERLRRFPETSAQSATAIRQIIGGPFDWCIVPEGQFQYGDNKKILTLPTYAIAKYPITYRQFQMFIDAKNGFKDKRWWEGLEGVDYEHYHQEWEIDDHPREKVSWYQSMAFCRWLSHRLGGGYDLDRVDEWLIRLPTEFEWEKSARGTNGLIYPYGNELDKNKCNNDGIRTTPVTQYPQGASPYGVVDMSGNVWEWCLTEYDNPQMDLRKQNLGSSSTRVLRGGSWSFNVTDFLHASIRYWGFPDSRYNDFGVRCVLPVG